MINFPGWHWDLSQPSAVAVLEKATENQPTNKEYIFFYNIKIKSYCGTYNVQVIIVVKVIK